MEPEPRAPSRARENTIIFTLVLLLGGMVVFFLDVISLGIFTYAIGVGGAIFALGCFHYLVWGRLMSEQVAEERRALLAQEEAEAPPRLPADGIQDLSRRRGIKRARPGA